MGCTSSRGKGTLYVPAWAAWKRLSRKRGLRPTAMIQERWIGVPVHWEDKEKPRCPVEVQSTSALGCPCWKLERPHLSPNARRESASDLILDGHTFAKLNSQEKVSVSGPEAAGNQEGAHESSRRGRLFDLLGRLIVLKPRLDSGSTEALVHKPEL